MYMSIGLAAEIWASGMYICINIYVYLRLYIYIYMSVGLAVIRTWGVLLQGGRAPAAQSRPVRPGGVGGCGSRRRGWKDGS